MIEESTSLVRYSMRFFADSEDQKEAARMTLSGLLVEAARAVENGEPEDLAEYSEITITLQKKRWDRKFVFELKAVEESGKRSEFVIATPKSPTEDQSTKTILAK